MPSTEQTAVRVCFSSFTGQSSSPLALSALSTLHLTCGVSQCMLLITAASIPAMHAVAPPGSYIERGVGKLCPKGTYQPDYNTMTFCYGCPVGLTTPSEGHNASMACQLAIKGYHTVNTTAAEPCPQGTYNDQEAAVTQCTVCPFGKLSMTDFLAKSAV
eukprot:GHUV01040628.1.p2 GENE.GHUV01040628.1~~GHUV01040628.1.p2  ORF type:complete len:159 (-),score=14.77 GHUV01040628.1:14-490(-)